MSLLEPVSTLIMNLNVLGQGIGIVIIGLIFAITRGISTTKEEMFLNFIGLSGIVYMTIMRPIWGTEGTLLYLGTCVAVVAYLIKYGTKPED